MTYEIIGCGSFRKPQFFCCTVFEDFFAVQKTVDQPEKLKGWDQEEDGVWAEMLFTRLGAVIHTYGVSSADPENIKSDRLYGLWNEEGTVIRFEGDLSGKGIISGNRLVITAEGGPILQFEKIDDCSVCKLH